MERNRRVKVRAKAARAGDDRRNTLYMMGVSILLAVSAISTAFASIL